MENYNWWTDPKNKEYVERMSWWNHSENKETFNLPISISSDWIAYRNYKLNK